MARALSAIAVLAVALTGLVIALTAGQEADAQSSVPTPTNTTGSFQQPPTNTPTPRISPTPRVTNTPTRTPTPTATPTRRPTNTPTPTGTSTPTPTRTPTPGSAQVVTPTNTPQPGVATSLPTTGGFTAPTNTPTPLGLAVPSSTPTPFSLTGPTNTPTQGAFQGTPSQIDLIATGLEITQGIQNMDNQMPLVEGRWTVARLYLEVPAAHGAIGNVSGAIGGWRGNTFLGIIYPANDPILGWDFGGHRANIDDSLWFYVPQSWRSGTVKFKGVVYQGEPANMVFEPDDQNNYWEDTVTFNEVDPLYVRLVPVHMHDGFTADDPVKVLTWDSDAAVINFVMADLFRLLPIYQLYYDPSLDFPLEFLGNDFEYTGPILPIDHQDGEEWDLTKTDDATFGEWPQINSQIALLKAMTTGAVADWFWYGMIHEDIGGNWGGVATSGVASGRFSFETDSDSPWVVSKGTTAAHELAHVYMSGPAHINCKGNEESGGGLDPAYPYQFPDCSMADVDPEGYMGFDVYWSLWAEVTGGPTVIDNDPGAPAPRQGFPFMGYQNPRWADPWDYCKILDGLGVACDHTNMNIRVPSWPANVMVSNAPEHRHSQQGARSLAKPVASSTGDVRASQLGIRPVLVNAFVDEAGGRGSIDSVVQVGDALASQLDGSRQRLARMAGSNSRAALVFADGGGRELSRYALASLDSVPHEEDSGGVEPTTYAITEWFDLPDGVVSIRIEVNGRTVAERRASANPPSVSLDAPAGGKVTAPLTVRWTASDPDNDALTATLLYSADDSKTWQAMVTGVPVNELTLKGIGHLAGSKQGRKQGRIKVVVSDGFNSAEAVSGRLEVPNSAPRPSIVGPKHGGTFPRGTAVILQGSAFDVEDLGLDGDRLEWTSNLDGSLGKGSEVMTETLRPGTHTITLTAKDKNGASGSAKITLIIEDGAAASRPDRDTENVIRRGLGAPELGDDSNALWFVIGGAVAGVGAGIGAAALWGRRARKPA